MTIDELVTILRFEMDSASKKNLDEADKASGKLRKNSQKLGDTFEKVGKSSSATLKTTGLLAASFRSLSASIVGAVSAGAAFG